MTQTSQPTNPFSTFDSFPLPTTEDSMDIFSFRPTLHDNFMFFDRDNNEETGGLQYHDLDLDDSSALHPLPALTDASSTDPIDATKNPRSAAEDPVDAGGDPTDAAKHPTGASNKEARRQNDGFAVNEHSSHVLGCDHRLFNLNLDLSRQLQQYLTVARPQDSPMVDLNSDSSPAADRGQEEPSCSNLLGDALSDASEFLAIIQSYRTERRGSSSSGDDTISSTRPRLGLIVILNLLSVHLELVVIYEKLFQSLSNQLFDVSSLRNVDGLHAPLPGLQLTDFSNQRGNLQTKILVHAILHQFEMIERILGLPAEFRVTEKQDDYSGLFEDGWARDLLAAMSNGRSYHGDVDNHCGLEALSSLRDMLKRVQISLKM
ncbi:MAG: hypothetical protein Q9161_003507 [Pseudevernia consocians]